MNKISWTALMYTDNDEAVQAIMHTLGHDDQYPPYIEWSVNDDGLPDQPLMAEEVFWPEDSERGKRQSPRWIVSLSKLCWRSRGTMADTRGWVTWPMPVPIDLRKTRAWRLRCAILASDTYDQTVFGHDEAGGEAGIMYHCQTPGCLAGHAAILAKHDIPVFHNQAIDVVAKTWMGLSEQEARQLFYRLFHDDGTTITSDDAADALERIGKGAQARWPNDDHAINHRRIGDRP